MGPKISISLLAVFLGASTALAQAPTPIQQATTQFRMAEKAEAVLNERAPADRTRTEYLKVIKSYERVYLITPHTGWADNALTSIARLYEEIKDRKNAIKTLQFLMHEYPQTPLRDVAERDIARLSDTDEVVAKETATVENIRFWEEDRSVRVVVDVSGDAKFKTGELKSPDRYFVDISPARLNSMLIGKEWPIESKIFEKIRVAQYDGSTVRIVLDGSNSKAVTASPLKDPSRIIIDVAGAAAATGSAPRAIAGAIARPLAQPTPSAVLAAAPFAAPATPVTPPPAPAPPTVTLVSASGTSAVTSAPIPATPTASPETAVPATASNVAPVRVVTEAKPANRSLIRSLGLKLSRVVIDAGHGGHDTGSIGPTGFTEKELVLDVAKRLKALIESAMDTEVVMTRTEDNYLALEDRTKIANTEAADLFISIHANSSQVKTVKGVETFFLNFNTQSRDAGLTATRENAATELNIHDLQDIVKKITLNDKVDESRELAGHIQTAMSKRSNSGSNRGVKQALFVVLIGATMPSVLAEISFISNPDEERRLKTPAYRQEIAESLLQGIRSYAETLSSTKTAKSQEKN